ncbi:MAG: hypothetical protein EOO88_59765 [Pedobacter sp.]|nr:MAG: hypothetical protein EOO88_59765 [Pedobacter sp.]
MSAPTLFLTYSVKESEKRGIFIGRINEIPGIFAQANSPEEVRDDLVRNTHTMRRYKEKEFLALLRKQLAERYAELVSDDIPQFHLEVRGEISNRVQELEVA